MRAETSSDERAGPLPIATSYILLFPPARSADTSTMRDVPRPEWRSLLSMHDFHADCEPGLPRKGIEPSDHVAIGAVVEVF